MREALVDLFADDCASMRADGVAATPAVTLDAILRIFDLLPLPILIGLDAEAAEIRSNTAGHALFGGGDRNLSQSAKAQDRPDFGVFANGEPVPLSDLPMQRAALTGEPAPLSECELRFDNGDVKFIRGKAVPVFGKDGGVRGSIGVFVDVTDRQARERRQALILAEIKHRSKNTLALVLAIAQMTLRSKLSKADYREFVQRVQVLGRSGDLLVQGQGETGRSIAEVISANVERHLGKEASRVRITGPDVVLPAATIDSLGMAIHELTTNACKYGALSVPSGSVVIAWADSDESDVVAVDWVERGGPPVVPPTRQGFGSQLLAQVLGEPDGRKSHIAFEPEGVECRLYVDLN